MNNRDVFLNNIAKNLNRERRREYVEKPLWSSHPQWSVLHHKNEEELIEIFKAQCERVHTNFKRTSIDRLSNTLRESISEYGGGEIITAKDERNKIYGLTDLYEELHAYYWDETKGKENVSIAEQANIGITFSDITLAESSTVTLFHNQYNSRTISLLPTHYIALIPRNTIVPRLSYATKMIQSEVNKGNQVPSSITFISGPSNSADIESQLVVGVHGPIKATYIVIDE